MKGENKPSELPEVCTAPDTKRHFAQPAGKER